ncbi:MAG: hypothetical protein Q8L26_08540 [Candidatus Omnitrophota bacterium]|nr:hypothetical protein [Candidatus Omnitrophota bacterium]
MRDITPEETKKYRHIISGQFSNFVLLATELGGIDTAVIAALNGTQGDYVTEPLAVLVNKEILGKLKSPGEILIAGKNLILE